MRILGIDYGEKRIGLAVSDPLGMFAQPLQAIEVGGDFAAAAAGVSTPRERMTFRELGARSCSGTMTRSNRLLGIDGFPRTTDLARHRSAVSASAN